MESTPEIITRLEKEWMDAWIRKDIPKCSEILSDDFLLSSAMGMLATKEEWLKAAKEFIHGKEFNWLDIKIREYGNTVVVNARTSQVASVRNNDWSGVFLLTDVWVLQKGRWQVVARHGTGPLPK